MRLAVEAPPGFAWDWPARGLAQLACAPVEPDVYVGVSIGVASPPAWDPITYSYEGGTFDVGRVGDEWWVAVHRAGRRFERVARFDRSFSEGEVAIAPDALDDCRHPLDGPLLDLLLTHRLIGEGGLVLSGTAVIDRGRALALLTPGDPCAPGGLSSAGAWMRRERGHGNETPGARFGVRVRDGAVRVYGLPGSFGHPDASVTGRLDAFHVLCRADRVFAHPVDVEEAAQQLLQHACAPLHAPDMAEQLLVGAARIAAAVPMLEVGVPAEKRVVSFDWARRETAHGFALPILG
jgi:hypothetical protein